MTNETILIIGFVLTAGYAYFMQVKYDNQCKLNDTYISIIRKMQAQDEESRDGLGLPRK